MMKRRQSRVAIGWILPSLLACGLVAVSRESVLHADDFRIATQVYTGEETQPTIETITVFADGVVYDFLTMDSEGRHREEITVFDPKRDRVVLLDPRRRVKTTLTKGFVFDFVAQIKARLLDTNRTEFADPKFELAYDGETERLILKNERMKYEIRGMRSKTRESFKQYIEFADWCARVNAVRPGNAPPFARLQVNSELADRQWMPTEVVRTIFYRKGLRTREYTMRTRHQTSWVLSQSDRQRIDRAGTAMAAYQPVRYAEFFELPNNQE